MNVESSNLNGNSYFENENGQIVNTINSILTQTYVNKDKRKGKGNNRIIPSQQQQKQQKQQKQQQQQQQNSNINNKVNKITLTEYFYRGQIGSVWSKNQIPLVYDIVIKFNFEISVPSLFDDGGDGFAFIFQSYDNNQLSKEAGTSIGYHGIYGHVAIEFDTYKNENEPNDNHISIQKSIKGKLSSAQHRSIALATPSFSMKDGKIHSVEIYFNRSLSSLSVTLDSIKLLGNIVVNELKDIDKSYIGFTSSTGYYTSRHTIYYCYIIEQ